MLPPPTSRKPKTRRGKKALQAREPKLFEGVKRALILKGHASSQVVNDLLTDIFLLKKPDAKMFNRKNDVLPFDNHSSIEFYTERNDCPLFLLGNSTKKRPNNLIFGRTFNSKVLDMVELGILEHIPMSLFDHQCALGSKPLFNFIGDQWNFDTRFQKISNLFLDFFHGEPSDTLNLASFDRVITLHVENDVLSFFHYGVLLKKSGLPQPRVELAEIGPRIRFSLRRTYFATGDLVKAAYKQPKEVGRKLDKNYERDELGNLRGVVHMQHQDFDELDLTAARALRKYNKQEEREEEVSEGSEISVEEDIEGEDSDD
ncbi:hypothetical protein P9112_012999 [Eukaryota sp. TZLM1-RC]